VAGSLGGYWLRLTLRSRRPGQSGLDALRLRSDFQLNPYALPQLLLGANRLTATAARADGPWNYRVTWHEGPEWACRREHAARVMGVEHTASVEAAGPRYPRMEAIEFWVEP
jgi:hypothetical protein